ncbi:hypothetical protein BT96DRAFT_143980 [Gymnopus androsaceus JB14]|uniref:Uncharacterized protein n=1 Tax=Gymnopus androsaceus JB14 TaxID=1447944 RepID=A0A6A4HE69_9AGAR|nr:hypothetical protein BT96DRAFT_143980 [Gymnopus androsaceus JB14]
MLGSIVFNNGVIPSMRRIGTVVILHAITLCFDYSVYAEMYIYFMLAQYYAVLFRAWIDSWHCGAHLVAFAVVTLKSRLPSEDRKSTLVY